MAMLRTAHHGVTVTDIEAVRSAFQAIGFSHQNVGGTLGLSAGMNDTLVWMDAQMEPAFGDFRSLVIENPRTAQQLFLIETKSEQRVPRVADTPCQGDLSIVVPIEGLARDAYSAMRAASPTLDFTEPQSAKYREGVSVVIDGQTYILTSVDSAGAVVHCSAQNVDAMRASFESVLGVRFEELESVDGGTIRLKFADMTANVEVEASEATAVAPSQAGKRYRGGNYYRITDLDFSFIAGSPIDSPQPPLVGAGSWQWCFPIENKAGYVYGPFGELIEIYDRSVVYAESPPYCPEVEEIAG